MHISWGTIPVEVGARACYARPIAVGHFLPAHGDTRGKGERPVVPSRVQAGRKETGDPSAKSPKQQRENWIAVSSAAVLSLSPSLFLSSQNDRSDVGNHGRLYSNIFAALFYLTRVRLSCDWIIQIPFPVPCRLASARGRERGRARASASLFSLLVSDPSIQRFSPPDDFPVRFPLRYVLLSMPRQRTSKWAQ